MDVFHCNGCGHLPHLPGVEPRRYFITNCGHVVCANCGANGSGGLKEQCAVCHIPCKTVEVNQSSNPEIKAYFMDPVLLLTETFKKFVKIANFQKTQTKNYQTLLNRMYDMCRKTSAENVTLKEENQTLKIKMEAIQQEHQNWIGGTPSPLTNGGSGFQLNLGRHVSLSDAGTPSRSQSPAIPGAFFSNNQNGATTPFFETPAANSTTSNRSTPLFTLRTPNDPNSTPANGLVFRPIAQRNINDRTSISNPRDVDSPRFCAAPGAGRPGPASTPGSTPRGDRNPSPQQQNGTNQTPDLATRLRGLRW